MNIRDLITSYTSAVEKARRDYAHHLKLIERREKDQAARDTRRAAK